ncbi:MAG: hypothetical protein EDX89_24005 [Acidobacteria bacterium]|nr:MAG: hypothetical protein EDX89_24005 [Acidobacteriota bacterium]MCE7957218.1 hypothetical protein [Acidobacteria bacterium ACB2]
MSSETVKLFAVPGSSADSTADTAAPVRQIPVIRLSGGELPAIVDAAEDSLLEDLEHPIYQRGGQLVAVTFLDRQLARGGIVREAGTPLVRPIQPANMVERLTRAGRYESYSRREQEWRRVNAPAGVAAALLARGVWRFEELVGVIETPALRPDGTVLDAPGYDPATGLFFVPGIEFLPVDQNPSRAEAEEAARTLLEVSCDFPFAGEEHRAAYLAAQLTPFARPAIEGPVPLVLIDKNIHGAGGTLSADLISNVATGRDMTRASYPREDEEMRKRITSIALAGDRLALFDNVTGTLGGAALNAALTGTTWRDRILGASEMTPVLPLLTTWFATSNNASVERDMVRRALPIRLDSPLEHPEERAGFRHPDVRRWVRENRAHLVRAALTILRAYFAAGAPEVELRSWGSYESWCRVVRQAVVYVGLPDPCGTRVDFVASSDSERVSLVALMDGLLQLDPFGAGLTAGDVVRRLQRTPDELRGLRDAILELCPPRGGREDLPTPHSLGKRLAFVRNRVVGGRMLIRAGSRDGSATWSVVSGSGGSGE